MAGRGSLQVNWRFPLGGALAALLLVLPTLILGNGSAFLLWMIAVDVLLVVVAIFGLVWSLMDFRSIRLQGMSVIAMLSVFFALFWPLFHFSAAIHDTGRWILRSRVYKAQVMAQPAPANGGLKHVEWDGWGFAGMDTTVYLVFDPADSLAPAANGGNPGKFPGLPCEVDRVQQRESHWYTVKFYTETAWNYCPPNLRPLSSAHAIVSNTPATLSK
jgi:hypothetical protein